MDASSTRARVHQQQKRCSHKWEEDEDEKEEEEKEVEDEEKEEMEEEEIEEEKEEELHPPSVFIFRLAVSEVTCYNL